jgi:hypothetical protein
MMANQLPTLSGESETGDGKMNKYQDCIGDCGSTTRLRYGGLAICERCQTNGFIEANLNPRANMSESSEPKDRFSVEQRDDWWGVFDDTAIGAMRIFAQCRYESDANRIAAALNAAAANAERDELELPEHIKRACSYKIEHGGHVYWPSDYGTGGYLPSRWMRAIADYLDQQDNALNEKEAT